MCLAHKFSYMLAVAALLTTSAATTLEGGIRVEWTHPVWRALGRGWAMAGLPLRGAALELLPAEGPG